MIYTAVLSGTTVPELARAEFGRIIDCVRWAEAYGPPADRVDIYSPTGRRTAQYRRPRRPTYASGIWVNAKIY